MESYHFSFCNLFWHDEVNVGTVQLLCGHLASSPPRALLRVTALLNGSGTGGRREDSALGWQGAGLAMALSLICCETLCKSSGLPLSPPADGPFAVSLE